MTLDKQLQQVVGQVELGRAGCRKGRGGGAGSVPPLPSAGEHESLRPGGDIDPCREKGWRGGKGFGEEGARPLFLQETGARSQGLGLGEGTAAPPKRWAVETQEPLGTRIERPKPGDGGALKQVRSLSSVWCPWGR